MNNDDELALYQWIGWNTAVDCRLNWNWLECKSKKPSL